MLLIIHAVSAVVQAQASSCVVNDTFIHIYRNEALLAGEPYNATIDDVPCPIADWDTGAVTSMHALFYDATSFNGDISQWETGKVQYMDKMFSFATNFNGDISQWDTRTVQHMDYMF